MHCLLSSLISRVGVIEIRIGKLESEKGIFSFQEIVVGEVQFFLLTSVTLNFVNK